MPRDMAIVPGYDAYFSFPKSKHGYSGVAVYVRQPLIPQLVQEGIVGDDPLIAAGLGTPPEVLDAEGRCIVMDFKLFVLFNVYFPNDGSEARRDFKMDYHHCARRRIDAYLQQGRHVILAGDINAVHEEIDHCDPKKSMKDHGITNFKELPHREWVDQIIAPKGPLMDTTRMYHPSRKGMFTWTRIDYILASEGLKQWSESADTQPDILGSDHCPVYLKLKEEITTEEGVTRLREWMQPSEPEASALLTTNWNEFSNRQKKLLTYFAKGGKTATVTATETTIPTKPSLSQITDIRPNLSKHIPSPQKRPRETKDVTGQSRLQSFFCKKAKKEDKQEEEAIANIPTEQLSCAQKNDVLDPSWLEEIEGKETKKQVWSSLFMPRVVPRCRAHNEPCKEFTVNKKGPNQGRRFYVCSRPVGPQEQDGSSNEYKCNFFQWKHERAGQ
ncbi:Class II abasic (AP) endonuclease [Apophysomyces ossiformis]|uniref:DNA-(apurinic or apyrimidinic site) endonuclease n=1 Tax=Apophysomyces ossiformis TaxID=679940 RepID=A0A8H7BVI0_9FUNG|nr:Class II abasic (AP) endonuclease [Apophysomyces ossiformis]